MLWLMGEARCCLSRETRGMDVSSVNAGRDEMLRLRGGTKRNGVEGGEWEEGERVWEGAANGDGRRSDVIGSGSDDGC